jgi:hypothetical protein
MGQAGAVRVVPVDPRDTTWEVDEPVYRVLTWSPLPAPAGLDGAQAAWSCEEHDIFDAEVDEVLAWARHQARPDQLVTVFARVPSPEGPGLVRLTGWDPTRNDDPPRRVE